MNETKYPDYKLNLSKTISNRRRQKILTIGLIITSVVLITLMCFIMSWMVYVVASLSLVGLTLYIIKHRQLKWVRKSLAFIGLLALFLFVVDVISGKFLWSILYAGPSLLYAATLIVSLSILFKKDQWDEYVPFQMIILVVSLSYIALSFVLGIIGASLAVAFFAAVWIRRGKEYNMVLKRMMHI